MKKYLVFLIIILAAGAGLYFYYTRYYKRAAPPVSGVKPVTGVIRLASWNMRAFSNSRDDSSLRYICRHLINYDFTALLEVRDEPVIRRTKAMLGTMGRNYDYQISDEVGRGSKERYVFIYDNARVRVIDPGRIFPDPDDAFAREPYYATFRSGNFDFTVAAIHVIWGDKVSERRAEIMKLADVYKQLQDMDPSEQDIILMGDFNRDPDDIQSYARLRSIPSMVNLFNPPEKSLVQDSSLYDNIWFQSRYLSEYKGIHGIDKFDETDFGNDDKLAIRAVSDHRPVWAEFDVSKDDD